MSERPGEFELIARFFKPLSEGCPGAFALGDDGALLEVQGRNLVVTTDTLVEGVHFLSDDPPASVAGKLLRVNLSDLAAMGAEAWAYTLALTLAEGWRTDWLAAFAAGLAADQALFGCTLVGGDTVATPGPLSLTLTALGRVEPGRVLRRNGARPGQDIWVSGTIGDAALGVRLRKGALAGVPEADAEKLIRRFRLPEPRLALGARLWEFAGAVIDVSDGLIADLGQVAAESGAGAEIEAARIPLSPPARRALDSGAADMASLLAGGDDFELLFTTEAGADDALAALAADTETPLARIGRVTDGDGVRVLDRAGRILEMGTGGYRHF